MPTPTLYINEFSSGLYTQRSPLVTPTTSQGLSTVVRTDVLADGLNMELSNNSTLVRSFGFTRYCSVAFANGEYPLNYYSFRNLAGTIRLMVDTNIAVYTYTASTLTLVYTKGSTQQTNFVTVANRVYMCNGTDAKKWDGTTVSNWGIQTPVSAPTLSFAAGALSLTAGYQYVFVYKNSSTGHVSTASPVSASTGRLTSQNITIQGASSADTQVDKIDIYRTLDGGSGFFYLATVNNGGTWTYTDSTPDSGLNNEISAPLNHANDAPPAGINMSVYHMGRLWTLTGNFAYFAGGPDTLQGVPSEAWPSANVFEFPGGTTGAISTSNGLLVFTNGDSYIIRGSDSGSFYSQTWMANFGVPSQNCLASDGDLLFIYTSRRQMFAISTAMEEIGFPIGDQLLANFDPTLSYVALHRSGTDSGVFISNGTDSVFRYLITKDVWSPVRKPVGGVGCIKSNAITASDYRLLLGRPTGAGYTLYRNLNDWSDDGTPYTCYSTLGTLVIAQLGAKATLDAISIERMPTGPDATVSILAGEVSGNFVELPNPVDDPPLLPAANSIVSKRHYLKFAPTPVPQQMRHLQAKVFFSAENYKSELLGFALMKP